MTRKGIGRVLRHFAYWPMRLRKIIRQIVLPDAEPGLLRRNRQQECPMIQAGNFRISGWPTTQLAEDTDSGQRHAKKVYIIHKEVIAMKNRDHA